MNGSDFNKFLNKQVKKEKQRKIDYFSNGGAKQYYDSLQAQHKDIFDKINSGKKVSQNEIDIFNKSVQTLKELTEKSKLTASQKAQFNKVNEGFSESVKAAAQNRLLFEKREKEKQSSFAEGEWLPESIRDSLLISAGQKQGLDKNTAYEHKERIAELDRQINDNFNKYVGSLDRESLKKALHDSSVKGQDKRFAKENYQTADEYVKASKAAYALEQSPEIEALTRAAGERTAQVQETKAAMIYKAIAQAIGSTRDPQAGKDLENYFKNKKYAKDNKKMIAERLRTMGFKSWDGISAEDIADYLVDSKTRKINLKKANELSEAVSELSNTFAGRIVGSAASLLTAPLKAVSTAETIKNTIKGWISDEKVYIDPNNPIYAFNNIYSNVLSANANALEEQYGEGLGTAFSEAYQFGMNLADNVIRAMTTRFLGGGKIEEAISLISMGAGVMNDTAVELSNLGMDARQAGTLSAVAGLAEIVTEAIPLEKTMKMLENKTVLEQTQLVRNLISQIFTEGLEEGGADVINDVSDLVVSMLTDESSKKELEIQRLMKDNGLSYAEAYRQWEKDHLLEYVKDIGSGMLSGGFMAGGAMGTASVRNNAFAGAQIMRAGNGSNRKAFKNNINSIIASAEREGQNLSRAEAENIRLREQVNTPEGFRSDNGNSLYDNTISEGLQSTDENIRKQAIRLANMRDTSGKQSMIGIGKLSNQLAGERTNATIGAAMQLLDETGAGERIKDTVLSALKQEELSNKELKLLLNDETARDLISDISGIELDSDSNISELEIALGNTYGKTASFLDNSSDFGRAYTLALKLRAEGRFGKDEESGRPLGTNAVKAFYSSFSPEVGMELEEYSKMFQLAYNRFYSNTDKNEVTAELSREFLQGVDEKTAQVRSSVLANAKSSAELDKKAYEKFLQERKLSKKERDKVKAERRSEKQNAKADIKANDSLDKEAIESAKKLSNLSESEKAEKYKNGGAIVESEKKLDARQSAIISFYDYRGQKHGITYRFVDSIESNKGTRGEYNHQTEVIQIRIGTVADMTATAGHELGHWLKAHYPEEYAKMQQYLKDTVFKTNYEAKVAAKIESYKKAGITIDEPAAFEELTNDCLFGVDMASSEFEEFVRANETLMQKAFRVIRELLQDLQHFMEDWRKQLPELFKNVTEIKMVQELYDDVEFMEYTADWVDGILNRNENEVAENENEVAENENEVGKKENTTVESGVRYSFADKNSLRTQIRNNLKLINESASIISVSYESGSKFDAKMNAIKEFKKFGYRIYRQLFGTIEIGEREIKEGARYMNTPAEYAALQTVPYVLRKGIEIDRHEKHKGESRASVTFAAKVTINGKDGIVAVAVKQSGKNKYHAHRILMPDGSEYLLNENDLVPTGTDMNGKTNQGPVIGTKSTNSISDSSKKSNSSFQVSDNFEETRDLIAVHNLSEEKLMKSLELGGMPMPSIAVIKAKNNHHDFGDISLVFSKDTIDPEKGAKVWTGDAYTPTFPQVEYKLSDKATDVYMTALDLQRSGMVDNFRSIRFDPDNMFDRLNNLDFEDLIRKEVQDDSTKMLYLYDTTGTVDALKLENIDKSNFEKWTRNLYESIIEKKGIKNNRDIYTSSGNRRSWEALHYEYNLENLVRAMKEKGTQGIGAFGSTITGASKVEFNSVEDIKNNRDKLLDNTSPEIKEAYDETRKAITDRFYELARSLPKYDNFTAIDDAAEMLTEAVLKFKTKTGMDNYIREQCEGWAHYSPSIVDDLLDIVNELRSLPAAYFEAKPQRGVSFNEVYTAVIPDNASAKLKSALDEAGVKYQTYKAGNEEDRVRVINSLDEVKFQISDTNLTSEQRAEIERKAQRREMAKLERENEQLKAALEYAKKQTKISKDFRHDESQTPRIAKQLIKKLSVVGLSESRKQEFIDKLNSLYDRIDEANLEGTGGSDVIYMAALEAVDVIKDDIKYTEQFEELAGRAQEFADYFKGRTYISEAQAKELRYHFGGVDKANQLVHGLNFAIAKGNETTLDMKWREIMESFPDFINEELTDTDEPLAIIKAMQDAREMIDGTLYSPFDEERLEERAEAEELGSVWAAEQEQMNDLAVKLMDSYTEAEWRATYADKAKGREQVQLIRQRQELRQRMTKYREQVNDRNLAFREKLRKDYQERYHKAISRNDLRVQMEKERLANYKERVAESRKRATERKRQTELKNKIKKIAFELGSMAANPNKKKHIPNGLVNTTREFLSYIETGDSTQNRLNDYLSKIRASFKEIEHHPNYASIFDNYNSQIRDLLDELDMKGGVRLNQLSSEELEKIYKFARVLKTSVSDVNKFFMIDRNRTVHEYQNELIAERRGKVKRKYKEFPLALQSLYDNNLKPVYFFDKLNSPTMEKMYNGLRAGQKIAADDIREASEVMERLRKKYGYDSWDLRKKYKFKLSNCEQAKEVELNLLQIMSLKAYSERQAGLNHILDGGFKIRNGTESGRRFTDKVKREIDETEYRITPEEFDKIISILNPEQIGFAHEMRDYLSNELSKKGNEVSRKLWDLELFNEKNYFPIKTVDEFNKQQDKSVVDNKKLKNWGASKSLIEGAHNPIYLEEFSDVWARHVNEMSLYHAFTLPLEDFQKVYGYFHVLTAQQESDLRRNYSDEVAFDHVPTKEEKKAMLHSSDDIIATVSIRNLFTTPEQAYIAQFLRDLNGGVKKADDTLKLGGAISKYKKMSTALNLRVTVQQPGAIARAFLYIDPKYFAKTTGSGLKGIKSDSSAVREMEKYSDAAFFKSLGYFDIDTGRTVEQYLNPNNYGSAKQKAIGFALDGQYRDEKMLFAPEMMDRITWLHIWNAAKAKVTAEEHLAGEALLKRTGEVFDNVVDKTQVYDSVFTRSGHMRSTSALAKMATSFLAEPTTTLNMYLDAFSKFKNKRVDKKFVAKAFASCFTATFLTNLLASVVSAMRHGKDDDNWWELWVGEFTSDFLTDIVMVNSIPLVRDLFNLAKGWDVERADMTLASNFINAIKKLTKAQQEDRVTHKEWIEFCGAVAAMADIPLLSLKKDIFGIFQAAKIMSNGTSPTYEGFKKALKTGWYDASAIDDILSLPQPSTNKYDMIYQLYAAGKYDKADARMEALIKKELESTKSEYGESDAGKEKRIREKIESGWETYIKAQMFDKNEFERIYQFMLNGDTKIAAEMKKSLLKESLENVVLMKDEKKEQGQARVKEYFEKTYQSFMQDKLKDKKEIVSAAKVLSAGNINQAKTAIAYLTKQGFTEEDVLKSIYKNINAQIPENEDFSRDGAIFRVSYSRSLEANALVNTKSMKAAALADIDHDIKTRVRIQNSLRNSGYKQDDIRRATDYLKSQLKADSTEDDEDEEKSIFKASDMGWTVVKADNATAQVVRKGLFEYYNSKGKNKKEIQKIIKQQISSIAKEEYYVANNSRRAEIRKLMWASGAYDSVDDVIKACNKWVKDIARKKYGN